MRGVYGRLSTDSDISEVEEAPSRERAPVEDQTRRLCLRLVVISATVGGVLRVVQYLHHNPYWNDEAALVLNILRRDFRQLLKPLDFAQAAPPMFLWVERWLALRLGSSEYGLRAFPVLLGLVTIPLFAVLAWRLLRPVGASWAVAWFSVNDRIIPQVSEVKQYSDDLFFSTLLLFVAFGLRRGGPSRRMTLSGIVAAVAFWFSFPSAIVFGGITLGLMPQVVRERRGVLKFVASMVPPILSAVALGWLVLGNPRDPYLNEFWAKDFFDRAHPVSWLAGAFFDLGDYPFASLGVVVLFVAGIGAWALWTRGRRWLVLGVGGVVGLALLASGLRLYPFGGSRVTLYLFPPLFLLAGAGASPFSESMGGHWLGRAWWVLPAPLLLLAIGQCSAHSVRPVVRSNIRPVVQYVWEHRKADESIFLAGGGVLPQTRVSGRNVEFLCYWRGNEQGISRQMIPPEQIEARRFWVVYSLISSEKLSKLDPLLRRLGDVAEVQAKFEAGPAGAILYQMRTPAHQPTTQP